MFNSAPVAFRCTRMSFERAKRVRGTKAPDLAILDLLSSGNEVNAHLQVHCVNRITVSCQVGHTTNSVTLDFNIGAQHLTYQWFQTTKFDNEELVIGCQNLVDISKEKPSQLTVDCQIPQRGACCPLDFGIVAAEKKQNGI